MRACIEPGCPNLSPGTRCPEHERQRQRQRNAQPGRAKYDSAWARHSRDRRAEQPWCSECGTSADLTLDHPTDDVYCRPCHDRMEARRRADVAHSRQR